MLLLANELGTPINAIGSILGSAAFLLVLLDKLNDLRTRYREGNARVSAENAKATALIAAADDRPIEQYRLLFADLKTGMLEVKEELVTVKAELKQSQDTNHECEERARRQQSELNALKDQNAGQQQQINRVKNNVSEIKSTLGLPSDGSGPKPPLPPS